VPVLGGGAHDEHGDTEEEGGDGQHSDPVEAIGDHAASHADERVHNDVARTGEDLVVETQSIVIPFAMIVLSTSGRRNDIV